MRVATIFLHKIYSFPTQKRKQVMIIHFEFIAIKVASEEDKKTLFKNKVIKANKIFFRKKIVIIAL